MLDQCNQSQDKLDFFKKFAKKPEGFLLLAGKNGTGKTFAAEAIYNDFFSHDSDRKKFISQVDLNLLWQKNLKDWGETTYLLNQFIFPYLLILDDIGTRTPTEAFMDFLYAIIDKRYRQRGEKGTIITTNLNSHDMRDKFGDAVVSRIASGEVYKFEGKDRRFKDF